MRYDRCSRIVSSVYLCLGLVISLGVTLMIFASLMCQPFAYNWDPSIPGGTCNERIKNIGYAALAGCEILIDVLIWSIPQAVVWRLHMAKENKIGVSAVFAIGVL